MLKKVLFLSTLVKYSDKGPDPKNVFLLSKKSLDVYVEKGNLKARSSSDFLHFLQKKFVHHDSKKYGSH